ncbi:MAG: sulfatase-like hydrolase/transferase [Bacilli bacterium]|nr:sulfatase-like hydrolase/transferase [Bacilli bacterium]
MKKYFIGQYRFCDLLTMCGTFSAVVGIFITTLHHYHLAIVLMLICALCDSFDGFFARKRKNTEFESTYGSELDSLSDIICFGVFPAIFVIYSSDLFIANFVVPIFILCGLIRLTYFNTLSITKTNEKGYFRGVPITTSAFVYPVIYLTIFINKNLYAHLSVGVMLILAILFISNIKVKKPDINKIIDYFKETRYSKLTRSIINFIIFPIFVILISDLYFKLNSFNRFALGDVFVSIYKYPLAFIYILFIFILINLFLTGIFKSTTKAKFTLLIIVTIFLTINDVKYIIMNNPVMLSDINYLNTSNIETAGDYLNTVVGMWIIKVIVKTLIMIVITVLIKKSKLTEIKFSKVYRIIFILITPILFSVLIGNSIKNSDYMVEKIYKYDHEDVLRIENFAFVYYDTGFYQGIMFNKFASSIFEPKGYSKKEVKELLSNVEYEEENWNKPNIVIILSESFSDLTKVSDITFNEDLLSNIHYLDTLDSAIVADTYTSTYGGQSVISEWEVQTASSNQFFIPSYIAYNEYYHNKNNKNINASPHIIHSLNDYYKMYLTPWGGGSYNSKYVYEKLGINKTKYELKGETKGMYLADSEITKSIIKELKKDLNVPKLLIYATGEGHMPCSKGKFDNYDVSIKSSSLNEEDTDLLKCYAQGIFDADKELGNLYNEIQNINQDTIVIFYGDHHPYITNSKGENIYLNLSYFKDNDDFTNNLRQYTTKGVIFSNYIKKMDKSIKYINLSYLSAYVYAHLDIKDKDYYNYVNNTRKLIPVFSRNYIYDPVNQRFTDQKELDKDNKEILSNLQKVQYYEFFDKK